MCHCETKSPKNTSNAVVDPVCGMTIDPATAAATSRLDGETIHFCAVSCKTSFDTDPERYLASRN